MSRKKSLTLLILLLVGCKIGIAAFAYTVEDDKQVSSFLSSAYAQSEGDSDGKTSQSGSKKKNSFDINVDMMKALEARKKELDKRENEIKKKSEMLGLIEEGIQAKLSEMDGIKIKIEKLIEKRDELKEASLQHLAKIYKTMPPNDAALQLEKLDTEIAVQVFTRMKSRTSSKILPFLQPNFSKKLSEEIVKRRLIREPKKKKR